MPVELSKYRISKLAQVFVRCARVDPGKSAEAILSRLNIIKTA